MNYQNPAQNNNILFMSAVQRCEYLHARVEELHALDKKWTYKHIADLSGLTESTVRHIVTDPEYDTRVSSLRDLCRVLGENFGQDVVYQDHPDTIALVNAKNEEIRQLAESIERLTETVHRLRANIDFHIKEAEMKTKVIEKLLSI